MNPVKSVRVSINKLTAKEWTAIGIVIGLIGIVIGAAITTAHYDKTINDLQVENSNLKNTLMAAQNSQQNYGGSYQTNCSGNGDCTGFSLNTECTGETENCTGLSVTTTIR